MIIKTKDFNTVVKKIDMKLGAETGFLPETPEVLAKTAIIGGGGTASLSIDTSKLEKGGSYQFICSFPGHYAIMRVLWKFLERGKVKRKNFLLLLLQSQEGKRWINFSIKRIFPLHSNLVNRNVHPDDTSMVCW